jgi:hypothetical protein
VFDRPLLTCRNLANLCPSLQAKRMPFSHRTSCSKASSVPGSTQTATLGSSTETKPRVIVWGKLDDTSLSPTLAGREAISSTKPERYARLSGMLADKNGELLFEFYSTRGDVPLGGHAPSAKHHSGLIILSGVVSTATICPPTIVTVVMSA